MYTLEDEDWKYDKWPEFFNGKNVADFYDKDIEKKLAILEAEEDELLRMELEEAKMMQDESDEDGVTKDELKASLKEVRGKKTVLKIQHKMKKNLRARSKNKKLTDMEDYLESKGFDVKETGALKKRSKSRKTLMELEGNLNAIRDSDDESDDVDSEDLDDTRGRSKKRQRAQSDDDHYMKDGVSKSKSLKNKSANKVRSLTASRREGTKPQRLPYKLEPEEHSRLAHKINKRFKHIVNVSEADRKIATKKPKHLFSGKMSNGKRDRR